MKLVRLQMWQRTEAIARSAPSDCALSAEKPTKNNTKNNTKNKPRISLDRSVKPMQRLHEASVKHLGEIAEIIASS